MKDRTTPLNNILRDCVWWGLLGFLCLARARGVRAACGETLADSGGEEPVDRVASSYNEESRKQGSR